MAARLRRQNEDERQPWASVLEGLVQAGVSQESFGKMNLYAIYAISGAWAEEHGDKKMTREEARKYGL